MRKQIQEIIETHFPSSKPLAEMVSKDIADAVREYKNEFELRGQLLNWIEMLVSGGKACDFAMSFPVVRAVADLKALEKRMQDSQSDSDDCRECGYWTSQGAEFCHRCGKGIKPLTKASEDTR